MFLTPAAIAKQYPVSKSTVYGACADELLPHYRVPSGRGKRGKVLVKEEDFLRWLESNRHEVGEVEDDGPLTHIR